MDSRVSSLLNTLAGVYRDPSRVDRDATTLIRSSAGIHLNPNIGDLVQNNGDSTTVLVMQGTIPMTFRGATYQCLVDIYLPPGYPLRPPVAFVRLAPNMYLKENHAHVGRDGQVYLPYLHEWRSNSHNLVELVVAMSSVFSTDPPVFTRAAASTPPRPKSTTPPPSYQQSISKEEDVQAQAEAFLNYEAEQANRVAEAARQAAKQEAELEKQREAQAVWDAKKRADLQQKVTVKLQKHLKQYSFDTKSTLQTDWQDEQALKHGTKRLENQIEYLKKTKEKLQTQIDTVDKANQDIEEWLDEAKQQQNGDNGENKEVSVDDLVQPTLQVHKQMLHLSAENASLTDALYFLDKALVKGNVDCTTHLKYVRRLAKRQFLIRAHLVKISQVLKAQSYGSSNSGGGVTHSGQF